MNADREFAPGFLDYARAGDWAPLFVVVAAPACCGGGEVVQEWREGQPVGAWLLRPELPAWRNYVYGQAVPIAEAVSSNG